MSIYLYDEALINKLRELTGDNRIHIVPPSQAISFLAQFDKDKVKFPAIVLSRNSVSISDYQNQFVKLKGETTRIDPDNTAVKTKLINARVSWTLDVYAVNRYTCDEIIRELIFYFHTYPRFKVKVPYDLNIEQNFDVFLDSEVVDNSDLVEFPNTGEYFRETLSLYTENAHFYSSGRLYLTNITSDIEPSNL